MPSARRSSSKPPPGVEHCDADAVAGTVQPSRERDELSLGASDLQSPHEEEDVEPCALNAIERWCYGNVGR